MSRNFRENLRNELDYQGLTVKELCARTGIPTATLDCYLGSRATLPSVEAAVKIARALQVSVEYLANGENFDEEQFQYKPSREAREIIHWIESLKLEQCRAIINLLRSFKDW
jgi:transcriptional regulator with XRE-family HTH domain